MRLEEVTPESVKAADNSELKALLARANQIFKSTLNARAKLWDGMVGVSDPVSKDDLLEAYSAVAAELDRRDIGHKTDDLDHVLLVKRLRGIDAASLPPVLVREGVVSLAGEFAVNPKAAVVIDVRIDAEELSEIFTGDLERRIVKDFLARVDKPAVVRRDSEGIGERIVPLYDLVLVPRVNTMEEPSDALRKRLDARVGGDRCVSDLSPVETEEGLVDGSSEVRKEEGPSLVFVSKPFVGEHASRQLDPGQFDDFRRENDKLGPGIDVIWGIKNGKTKIQSVRFDAAKFTPAEAKKWLKDHDMKTALEPAKKKTKKFVKSEEERIVGGVVYSADGGKENPDAQGDWAEAEEIYDGMKTWMMEGHPMKIMHKGSEVDTPLIENFFADVAIVKEGSVVPAGSWYISVHIPEDNEELWEAIRDGEITGFSMAGDAQSVDEEEF